MSITSSSYGTAGNDLDLQDKDGDKLILDEDPNNNEDDVLADVKLAATIHEDCLNFLLAY